MTLAWLAAAATGVQVGAALVASEAVVADVGALRLGFLRYAIALGVLLPLFLARKSRPVARADLLPVALIGIGQFGLLIALMNLAVLFASSARVALIFAMLPLVTLGVERLLKGGRSGAATRIGIALSISGIVCLLAVDALGGRFGALEWIGLGAAALATLTGAVCSVLYRPYLQEYGVIRISVIAMAASLPPLALLGALETPGQPPGAWSGTTLVLIVFVGLSSGAGFLMWLYALSRLEPARVTAFLALGPVTAAVLSVSVFAAPVTPGLVAAILLVCAGLTVMSRERG